MKNIIYLQLILIFMIISLSNTNAQYYEKVGPNLKIGNFWIHIEPNANDPSGGTRTKREVVKDTIINSLNYYKVRSTYSNSSSPEFDYYRINDDSTYLTVRSSGTGSNNEFLYYKLDAQTGDSWKNFSGSVYYPYIYYTVISSGPMYVWGENDTGCQLYIEDSSGIWEYNQVWSNKFGMLFEWAFGYEQRLIGCFLDGVAYGDTNVVVGIDDEIVLHKFELYQNYPNPFNPETKIKFTVRQLSDVNLIVYDPLGRVVAILVNEEKTAGTFEVIFNAENLASGVYLYRLQVKDFVSSKKMTLIK